MSKLKYVLLIGAIVYEWLYYRTNSNDYLKKEYARLFVMVILISLYSVLKSAMALHFSTRTIEELAFMVCPMLYTKLIINNWEKKDIEQGIKIGLYVAFVGYLLSLKMNFILIYKALFESSYSTSYSELESFTYCGLALAFLCYFAYYNKNVVYVVISFIFVIMTFKRVFILIGIALIILSLTKMKNKEISLRSVDTMIILICIIAVGYWLLMQPEAVSSVYQKYGINIAKITMNRSDRLRWLLNSDYITYGFGSSTEFMYRRFNGALEMEMCKIIVELGYLPVFVLISSYLKFSKANLYTFIFMSLMLVNLIVSSGLTGTFPWCIIWLTIASITIYPEESTKIKKVKI